MEQFVLVADDDQEVLNSAQSVIEHEGYIAILALDGKQAYKAMRKDVHLVAVFIDLDMPYITGVELVKFMKGDEHLSRVPAIVMDDNADAALLKKALEAGAIASIQKPFNDLRFASILRTFAGGVHGAVPGAPNS